MAYPTAAQVQAESQEPLLSGAATDKITAWWRRSIRAVEAFCGQKFTAEDTTLALDGADNQRLALPRRLAVLSGLSVSAPVGSSLLVGDVLLSPGHDSIYIAPDAFAGANWVEKIMRSGRPPRFPAGYGTVSVTGTWGWTDAELPGNDFDLNGVAQAILLDMEDQARADSYGLANTVRSYSRLGVAASVEGPLGVTMAASRPEVGLPIEAQEALLDYIWAPAAVS